LAAIRSATMIVVRFVGAEGMSGRIDASTTWSAPTPRTLPQTWRDAVLTTEGLRGQVTTMWPETPVVNYKSDDKTRDFFTRDIGPHFHFTYHLNQYRLANANLTYGDLIREWVAEYERRQDPKYRAPTASHGEYNRYIRDFFSDERNKGKSLRDAVASWNAAKRGRGDHRYRRQEE
jgi:hypothetical protein